MTPDLLLGVSVLVASFFLLIKAADYLVSSSSILGERAGISKFVIGLTIVAIGTSLPELITGLIGILTSESNGASFVLGTVIGSNVANILLVFGILLVLAKKFHVEASIRDILFLIFSSLMLGIGIFLGNFGVFLGTAFILLFAAYLYISVKSGKKADFEGEVGEAEDEHMKKHKNWILILILISSLVGLNLAAKGVVYSIELLGPMLGLSVSFLTLTTVAFATSLPEIIVTYASARKKEFSLGVGNVIGSNVSNILLIVGTSALVGKVSNNELTFNFMQYAGSFVLMLVITILFTGLLQQKVLKRGHGYALLAFYFLYIYLIF